MPPSDWHSVLVAARRAASRNREAGRDAAFTSRELALEARIKGTDNSTSQRIASAWCSKLAKWGYIRAIEGADEPTLGRNAKVYEVTAAGQQREPPKTRSMVGRVRTKSKGRPRKPRPE
jgi:hypothetical protein